MMNNQTMHFLPDELFFSIGRVAAILGLLFIVIIILTVIFLLFFKQRNTTQFDEQELRSETDPTITENRTLEMSSFKQYSSTDINPLTKITTTTTTSMNSSQPDIDEQLTGSRINLISSN